VKSGFRQHYEANAAVKICEIELARKIWKGQFYTSSLIVRERPRGEHAAFCVLIELVVTRIGRI
jgi:hypothetical protein